MIDAVLGTCGLCTLASNHLYIQKNPRTIHNGFQIIYVQLNPWTMHTGLQIIYVQLNSESAREQRIVLYKSDQQQQPMELLY